MGIIYYAKNIINGKLYIGQTSRKLLYRITQHCNLAAKEQPRLLLHKAIKKYGRENFEWVIIEECDKSLLDEKEIYFISLYDTLAPKGYNLSKGGITNFGASGAFHYLNQKSEEDKKEWIANYREGRNNPNYGNGQAISGERHFFNKMTFEEKEVWLDNHLRGDNNYQSSLTEEDLKNKCWMNKISTSQKEKWIDENLRGENNPFYKANLANPEKYKEIYKQAGDKKRGVNSKVAKAYIVTTPLEEEILVFNLKDFCRNYKEVKLNASALSGCAKGRILTHKGYKCRYQEKKK